MIDTTDATAGRMPPADDKRHAENADSRRKFDEAVAVIGKNDPLTIIGASLALCAAMERENTMMAVYSNEILNARDELVRLRSELDEERNSNAEWQEIALMVQGALDPERGSEIPPMNFDTAIRNLRLERDAASASRSYLFQQLARLRSQLSEANSSPADGHNQPCLICNEPCSSIAGNPSLWPVRLGNDGWHHVGCLRNALQELDKARAELAQLNRLLGDVPMTTTTDHTPSTDKKLDGLDPRKTFYLLVAISNDDGSMDLGFEAPTEFATLEEAVEEGICQADEHGSEYFIYEARPVKRISRITVKVEDIAP